MLKRTRSFYGIPEYKQRFTKKQRRMFKSGSRGYKKVKPASNFAGRLIIPRGPSNPFPDQKVVTLRYCANINLDATLGLLSKYLFRANSVYDPDYTGTGHQPYGYDQLTPIYNHYEVLNSYITVTATPTSVANVSGNIVVGISLKDDATTENSVDTMRESKNTRWDVCSSYGKVRVSNYYSRRKVFPNEFQALGASVNANPSEESFFCVWQTLQSDAVEPGGSYVMVTIDYRVRFWELKDLGQS